MFDHEVKIAIKKKSNINRIVICEGVRINEICVWEREGRIILGTEKEKNILDKNTFLVSRHNSNYCPTSLKKC